jgi:ATP-dependent Clp protease ATP-binding subunit ClpC
LIIGQAVGWLALGVAAVPIMTLLWYKGELIDVPSGSSDTLTDTLSSTLLGHLPKNPSPIDIAQAVMKTPSGQFMAVRFGLTGNFFANILSSDPTDSKQVWELADTVRRDADTPQITGAVMAVALTRSFTGYEALLAHMKLEYEDLINGVRWRAHLRDLMRKHEAPRRTGGIARDWSFGYIPLLERFGRNISAELAGGMIRTELETHHQALATMTDTFGTNGRQNVVLVGPSGVGKSTLVYAFAETLLDASSSLPSHLKFRQVFMLDSAALIAAAPGRGELEGLIMRVLSEAHNAKNIILCLDDAQLFFEEGVGSVDITNVLQPILEAGRLRIILTMDEQRLLQIGQRNPSLFNALNRVNITEPTEEETLRVLEDKLVVTEHQRKIVYTYHALSEAYNLSLRYIHDIAMPARAFKLLEAAAGYADKSLVTAESVQKAIEQTIGVKVGVATGEEEREKLLNLESLIHERMINQVRAVQVVSDALRRARAGVRNQERPIGTFLFLGPTGVGKTELSKALADVYFGGETNMVRLDLNEFVRPEDVARLIADGADDPNSLTAQMMKQPFSVVLLDEIEKAHPQVLTTLLQLLDEGILRDVKNREISFRDAIVIATSNAGAERIREYIERGYQLEQFESQITNELISSGAFRPEFLNRFDEIVVFRPLTKPELLQVVDLILKGINKTLAPQKVSVAVADNAKEFLVERGYDPRLGARPMRRVVQRAVENTMAKLMLSGTVVPGQVVSLSLEDVQSVFASEDAARQITQG